MIFKFSKIFSIADKGKNHQARGAISGETCYFNYRKIYIKIVDFLIFLIVWFTLKKPINQQIPNMSLKSFLHNFV